MFLLIFSTVLDFYTGIKIYEAQNRRNKLFWLWLSVGINLGFLGVFKYYNFFADSCAGNGVSGHSNRVAQVVYCRSIIPSLQPPFAAQVARQCG